MENTPPSSTHKILQIIAVLVVIYSFVASFFELPPATIFIKYYCTVFDTDRYSPILIGGILVILGLTPLIVIKQLMNAKKK
jgi:hypothetical protein